MPQTTIYQLPDEVLLLLFSYLPFADGRRLSLTSHTHNTTFKKTALKNFKLQFNSLVTKKFPHYKTPQPPEYAPELLLSVPGGESRFFGGVVWEVALGEDWGNSTVSVSGRVWGVDIDNTDDWVKLTVAKDRQIRNILQNSVVIDGIPGDRKFGDYFQFTTKAGSNILRTQHLQYMLLTPWQEYNENPYIIGTGCHFNGKVLYIPEPDKTLSKVTTIDAEAEKEDWVMLSDDLYKRILKYERRGVKFEGLSQYTRHRVNMAKETTFYPNMDRSRKQIVQDYCKYKEPPEVSNDVFDLLLATADVMEAKAAMRKASSRLHSAEYFFERMKARAGWEGV